MAPSSGSWDGRCCKFSLASQGHGGGEPDGVVVPKPALSAEDPEPDASWGHPVPTKAGHGADEQQPSQAGQQRRQFLHVHLVCDDPVCRHSREFDSGVQQGLEGGQAERPLPHVH